MLFTDENGQLTKDAYDFLFAVFQRIGGSLDSLNAATLEDHTWEEPGAIGSVTPQSGKFTTLAASGITSVPNLTITKGVSKDGGGLKHTRLPVTVTAGTNVSFTVTWDTPFLDTNYTVSCTLFSQLSANTIVHVTGSTANDVTVVITNTGTSDISGTLHIIGVHD